MCLYLRDKTNVLLPANWLVHLHYGFIMAGIISSLKIIELKIKKNYIKYNNNKINANIGSTWQRPQQDNRYSNFCNNYNNPIQTSGWNDLSIIINQTSSSTLIPSEECFWIDEKTRNQTPPTTENLDCMNFL